MTVKEWSASFVDQYIGLPSAAECLDELLEMIKRGAFLNELRADFVCNVARIFKIVSAVLEKIADNHEHVIGADPLLPGLVQVAQAMGVAVPAEGILSAAVLRMIISALLEELAKLVREYLADA